MFLIHLFTVGFVRNKTMADSNEIFLRVQLSKISRVELSVEELNLVLQTLLYDGKLEIVDPKVVVTLSSSFFLSIHITHSSFPLGLIVCLFIYIIRF